MLLFFFLAAFTIYSLTSKYKQYVLGLGAVKGFGIISGKFGFMIKSSGYANFWIVSDTYQQYDLDKLLNVSLPQFLLSTKGNDNI